MLAKFMFICAVSLCLIFASGGISFCAGFGGIGGGDFEVKLTCPATVKTGAVLNATAIVYNNNCTSSKTFMRVYTGMIGNPGTSFAGYGFWGPFVRTITSVTVPKATCDEWGDVITPGTKNVGTVKIIDAVPGGLTGKLADAFWGPLMAGGVTESQGLCSVQVIQ